MHETWNYRKKSYHIRLSKSTDFKMYCMIIAICLYYVLYNSSSIVNENSFAAAYKSESMVLIKEIISIHSNSNIYIGFVYSLHAILSCRVDTLCVMKIGFMIHGFPIDVRVYYCPFYGNPTKPPLSKRKHT